MTPANEVPATLKVLIVDDSADIRDVLTQTVQRLNHVASTAEDGMDALDALRRESFDLMILDISMPRLSGIGVARWLHDNPDVAPDMRTVVLSAWAGDTQAVLQELGVNTVMQKPIRLKELRDLITEVSLGQRLDVGLPSARGRRFAQ